MYERLLTDMAKAKHGDIKLCPKLRSVINQLHVPDDMNEAIRGLLEDLGCEIIDELLLSAWGAIKKF